MATIFKEAVMFNPLKTHSPANHSAQAPYPLQSFKSDRLLAKFLLPKIQIILFQAIAAWLTPHSSQVKRF